MVTQEFLSDLWTPIPKFKNIGIRGSYPATPIPRALQCTFAGAYNPEKSKGNNVNGYRAPIQIINVHPPAHPPTDRERNTMNPLEQKQVNLAMEKIAVPDPRMNITGNNIPTTQKLENMGIQTAPFNYSAIIGVVGILAIIMGIVWLARRK